MAYLICHFLSAKYPTSHPSGGVRYLYTCIEIDKTEQDGKIEESQ